MNFGDAFHVLRELGKTDEGENLPLQALTAIHAMHRLGALIVLGWLGWLSTRLVRAQGGRVLGQLMGLMLLTQFCLGLSNVWFSLPIGVAVAHTGGAAVLIALLVVINFQASKARLRV